MVSHCSFNLHSRVHKRMNISSCLSATVISSSVNCLFTSFAHFSAELFFSYWFIEIVYITEYWFSLSYMYYKYLTTCLQVVFLLCLLYLFYPQKFLLLKWVEFINLCIYTLGFLCLKKNPSLPLNHNLLLCTLRIL